MSLGPLAIRWVWVFLDTPAPVAEASWAYWAQVTRSTVSTRRGADGEFATLLPADGAAWVKLQRVGHGGGVHLDLDVDVVAAAATIAEGLGATRIGALGQTVVIMRSPGGFVFCLTTWRHERAGERQHRSGEPDLLDQVCLDIPAGPPDRYAAELAFWARLTGWQPGDGEVSCCLQPPRGIPARLSFQRAGVAGGQLVRGSVDFACADRSASQARHVELGATVEAEHGRWTVLRDPVGRRYRLTDRPVGR